MSVLKINAADAVEDPAVKEVIRHLHIAFANSKEVKPVVLMSALSNMLGMLAVASKIDFELLFECVRADFVAQAMHMSDVLVAAQQRSHT
jgi:SUMO ligase MMS21 Smc5/6 complex component